MGVASSCAEHDHVHIHMDQVEGFADQKIQRDLPLPDGVDIRDRGSDHRSSCPFVAMEHVILTMAPR
jgi:hypothetical protein